MRNLYFISGNGFIKIGIANDVNKRLLELQTGNPNHLVLIACFFGLGGYENWCHRKLRSQNVNNEWFRYSNELKEVIDELVQIATKRNKCFWIDKYLQGEWLERSIERVEKERFKSKTEFDIEVGHGKQNFDRITDYMNYLLNDWRNS